MGKLVGRPCPILVSFVRIAVKEEILRNKKVINRIPTLKQVWISEDQNVMVRKQKNEARSVVKLATRQGHTAKQKGTGAVIDSIYYPYSSLDSLPRDINIAMTKQTF